VVSIVLSDRRVAAIVGRHELTANLRTTVLWFLSLGALLALVCALQPALAAGPLAAKISSLPNGMRDALGLSIVDFHRPVAYLATNFTYVMVGAGLFGGLLGARVVAKEEVQRTAEVLYSQPVHRSAILAGKAISVATYAVTMPLLLSLIPIVILGSLSPRSLEPLRVLSLFAACSCVAVAFAGIGMLVASTLRHARGAANVSLAIVFGMFVVGVFSSVAPSLGFVRWLSPFKLVEATSLVSNGLDPRRAAVLLGIGALCAILAVHRYRTRDLHA
jgi:ABC-2 type transport system permease protein